MAVNMKDNDIRGNKMVLVHIFLRMDKEEMGNEKMTKYLLGFQKPMKPKKIQKTNKILIAEL